MLPHFSKLHWHGGGVCRRQLDIERDLSVDVSIRYVHIYCLVHMHITHMLYHLDCVDITWTRNAAQPLRTSGRATQKAKMVNA